MSSSYDLIVDVLNQYFDGLYFSDTDRLRSVFHPRAQYVCATDGSLTYLTMDEYFPVWSMQGRRQRAGRKRERITSFRSNSRDR
jgi:hypothetical protein